MLYPGNAQLKSLNFKIDSWVWKLSPALLLSWTTWNCQYSSTLELQNGSFMWFNLIKNRRISSYLWSIQLKPAEVSFITTRSLAKGPSGLLTPVRNNTCLSWQHRAGRAQGRHQSSACTQCPQAQLPYRAWPCFSFPWFLSENVSSEGPLLASSLSYLRMREGFLANQAPCACSPLFLFLLLICSLSLAQESASSGKAGMSFLNCVYLLALGCESAPVNCILILSAVCICFPLPLSPGLIYGFPLPCFLLSQWQGVLCHGCSGLGQEEGLSL